MAAINDVKPSLMARNRNHSLHGSLGQLRVSESALAGWFEFTGCTFGFEAFSQILARTAALTWLFFCHCSLQPSLWKVGACM